jgi:hypothetical protein
MAGAGASMLEANPGALAVVIIFFLVSPSTLRLLVHMRHVQSVHSPSVPIIMSL